MIKKWFWKDLFTPTIVRVLAYGMITWGTITYLSDMNFFNTTSRNELVTAYKDSNVILTKSIRTLERIDNEVKNSYFIQSQYLLNQMDETLQIHSNFINAQMTFDTYGDSTSKAIVDSISYILEEVDNDIYYYKKQRELFKQSALKICDPVLKEREFIKKEHQKRLRVLIANENYLRNGLPIFSKELSCLQHKLKEDFKKYSGQPYDTKLMEVQCLKELDRQFNLDDAYYIMYLQLSENSTPEVMESEIKKIDTKVEKTIKERSLQSCQ